MSLSIQRVWYDVREFLPGDSKHRPVRAINSDECTDFYFMAYYRHERGEWDFFDEEYDKNGEDGMQVTHWCEAIVLEEEHKFIIKDNK